MKVKTDDNKIRIEDRIVKWNCPDCGALNGGIVCLCGFSSVHGKTYNEFMQDNLRFHFESKRQAMQKLF